MVTGVTPDGVLAPLEAYYFGARLLAAMLAFATAGSLLFLNFELWRSRDWLFPHAKTSTRWAAPVFSAKVVILNIWAVSDMVMHATPSVYGPVKWRAYVLILLGAAGVFAIRQINRAIDAHVAQTHEQLSLQNELRRD